MSTLTSPPPTTSVLALTRAAHLAPDDVNMRDGAPRASARLRALSAVESTLK